MTGPMTLEAYVLAKRHLLAAANLVSPDADVKRTFVALLNDMEEEAQWARWEIIHAMAAQLAVWTYARARGELRLMPQSYEQEGLGDRATR